MKKLFVLIVAVICVMALFTDFSKAHESNYDCITDRMNHEFLSDNYRIAWSRIFGLGKGNIIDSNKISHEFFWVAWSNTDGYLQFIFSHTIEERHIKEIKCFEHPLNNNWNANIPENDECDETLIGTISWFQQYCIRHDGKFECDYDDALDDIIYHFNKMSFIENMEVIFYFSTPEEKIQGK